VWDETVVCKNRDRGLDGDIATKFFVAVLNLPEVRKLLSYDHFTVDDTLIEAWESFMSRRMAAIRPPKARASAMDECRAQLSW
jgi:hypothetical protein